MSIDIIKLLDNASIDGYRVNTVNTESYELFFVHERLETVRESFLSIIYFIPSKESPTGFPP